MTLAAFALLAAKGTNGERDVRIDDLAGLAQRRPWLALALAVCMLSLLGFPVTAGFIGKWYILVAATSSGQVPLAADLVLASVISAGYYLPVIMAMYMQPEPSADAHAGMRLGRLGSAVVAAAVARDRKSTRLNSSHGYNSYAVFCFEKKKTKAHDR